MSDVFRKTMQPKKRTLGDKIFDNFGWIVAGVMLFSIIGTGIVVYAIANNLHEIAREAGSIAKSAADGYANANPKK